MAPGWSSICDPRCRDSSRCCMHWPTSMPEVFCCTRLSAGHGTDALPPGVCALRCCLSISPLLQRGRSGSRLWRQRLSVTQALLAGVPLLLHPKHVEQMLLARRIEAIGGGAPTPEAGSDEGCHLDSLAGNAGQPGAPARRPVIQQAPSTVPPRAGHRAGTAVDRTAALPAVRNGMWPNPYENRKSNHPHAFIEHFYTTPRPECQDFYPPLIRLQQRAPHPQRRRVLWMLLVPAGLPAGVGPC